MKGIPTIILGVCIFFMLPDYPESAKVSVISSLQNHLLTKYASSLRQTSARLQLKD